MLLVGFFLEWRVILPLPFSQTALVFVSLLSDLFILLENESAVREKWSDKITSFWNSRPEKKII